MKKIFVMLGCLSALSGAQGTEVHSVEAFNQLLMSITDKLQDHAVLNHAVLEKMEDLSPYLQDFMRILNTNETKEEPMNIDLSENDVSWTVQGIISDLNSHQTLETWKGTVTKVISVVDKENPLVQGVLGMLLAFYPTNCYENMTEYEKQRLGIKGLDAGAVYALGRGLLEQTQKEHIDYETALEYLNSGCWKEKIDD